MQRFLVGLMALGVFATSAPAQDKGGPPALDFKAIGLTAELFTAIRQGDKAATIAALDHGADPNRRNWIDMTPMDWALLLDRKELLPILLERGARLDNGTYGSPAIGAAMLGREKEALELLDKGAGAVSNRPDKATTLMLAAAFGAPKVIDRLKPDAAELAKQDIDGATALIYAARLGQVETSKRLIALGAALDQADSHGRTPLMYAARGGRGSKGGRGTPECSCSRACRGARGGEELSDLSEWDEALLGPVRVRLVPPPRARGGCAGPGAAQGL